MKQSPLALVILILSMSSCSTTETSSTETAATDSSNVVLTSKQKVHWATEPYEVNDVDYQNPIGIMFNNTAETIDTARFRAFLGPTAKFEVVDPSDVNVPRYILKLKQSEISIVQVWESGQSPRTMIFSALIRNEEIPLKNGVKVGMSKNDVLAKYDWIKIPSDIIYLVDGDGSLLRFEFRDNILIYIEFWAGSNLVNSYAFGGLNIVEFNRRYIPVSSPKDKDYYLKLMGNGAQIDSDAISVDIKNDQGTTSSTAIRHLITSGPSQLELIDFEKNNKTMYVSSAIIYDPKIEVINSIKVGTSRKDVLKLFDLNNTKTADQTLVLNTERGKLRVAFKEGVVSVIEFRDENVLSLREKTVQPEIAFSKTELSRFTLSSAALIDLSLSKDGTFSITSLRDGTAKTGRWSSDNYTLSLYPESDTLTFEVRSFTPDELIIVTNNENGGNLINEVRNTDRWFYGRFYRNIYSSPFTGDQVAGSWSTMMGTCTFGSGDLFSYGDPDCDTQGSWSISKNSLRLKLEDPKCEPFDPNSTIERLSKGLMIIRSDKGDLTTLTRTE